MSQLDLDKKIKNYLENVGFSETEIKIYLFLLSNKQLTISKIAKGTGIPRTTVTDNLSKLISKSLVDINAKKKIKTYTAKDPSRIRLLLADKKVSLTNQVKTIEEMEEELPFVVNNLTENQKISVRYYEGPDEVHKIYLEAFSANEMRSYVNLDITRQVTPGNYQLFQDIQDKKKSRLVREIVDESPESFEIGTHLASKYNFEFKQSSIPKNLTDIDVMMYDGKVAMINFKELIVASVLINKEYYESSKNLFDFIWDTI